MDDAKMLELLHKNPNKGMNVLMDEYAGLIYAIVKHVLADFECDSSEIEDCVAEVFSEFYFDYSAYDPKKSSLKNYLCRIAKNNAIDLLRKKQKQGARVDIDTDDFPIQIPDETNLEESVLKPIEGEQKIFVLGDFAEANPQTQNKLLKVLEEPPEYAVIILIAKNSNAFLPTILSRATRVRLMPLENNLVENYLIKKSVDAEKAKTLSVMSGGSIGKALKLCEDEEAISLRQQTVEHLMNIQTGGNKPLYDFIKFLKQNKSSCGIILDIISGFYYIVNTKIANWYLTKSAQ